MKARIMDVVLGGEIPGPREAVIICLADACGIFERLLSGGDWERASARMADVRRLDLIGRVMSQAILDLQDSVDPSLRSTGPGTPRA